MNENKKINVFMIIALLLVLPILGYLGFNYYKENKDIEIPDFKNKDYKEVMKWCSGLNSRYACEFRYDSSKDVKINQIIDYKVDLKENVNVVTFTVCDEKIDPLVLPDLSKKLLKEDIRYWAHDNNIENINYVEQESENHEYMQVIRIEPDSNVYKDTPITVYINNSNNNTEEKKDETKEGDIVVKADDYIGLSVSDFETKVKTLGLKPNHNSDKDDTSSKVSKGNIVWHGSGSYIKGETINYGICKEKVDGIKISADTYIGLSESEFKTKADELGLKANHNSDRDAYSDTVSKGRVVWHGSGEYEKNETFNYGLSLGKKDASDSDDSLYISQDKYVGKSESEVKSITESLGLKPTHLSDRDDYSDTVAKGSVITHGYGQYEKNEAFNCGLSLGKKDSGDSDDSLYISKDKYVGKTEEEFISIAQSLGLKPTHLSDRDAYSDTIDKGSIITHGYGQYEKNEAFNYGLSLGKNSSGNNTDSDTVNVVSYANKKESELLDFLSKNGLKAGNRKESYSDSVAKGNVIFNDTGNKKKGDSVSYIISLGVEQVSKAYLNSFKDLASAVLETGSYETACANASEYLNNAGFTNYTFKASKSKHSGAGVLLSVTVDGNEHTSRNEYKTNAAIVFTICDGYE